MDEGGGENERGNGKHPFKLKAFCTKNRVHLIHCRHILSKFFFFHNYCFSLQRVELPL